MVSRLLPHGAYILVPAVLSTIAWLASLMEDGCDYAAVSGDVLGENGFGVAGDTNPPPYVEIGFSGWSHPIYYPEDQVWKANMRGSCLPFPAILNDDGSTTPVVAMDASWMVAKAFDFLSLVLGGGGALFLWFSSCFVFGPGSWRWAGYEVFAASILQALAFVWFNTTLCTSTGNSCRLFVGSNTDIMAATFWMIAAISIFVKYPEPQSNVRPLSPRASPRHEDVLSGNIDEPPSVTITTTNGTAEFGNQQFPREII